MSDLKVRMVCSLLLFGVAALFVTARQTLTDHRPGRGQGTWKDVLAAYKAYDALVKQGKYAEALPHAQRITNIVRKLKGEKDPDYAQSLNNLALLYDRMGDYGNALPLYTQALQMRKKLLRDGHPDVGEAMNNLGLLYKHMGEYGKALPLLTQALKTYKKVPRADNPEVAMSLNNLATVYLHIGEYGKALPLLTQALKTYKKVHGAEHPQVAMSLYNLALLYEQMGDYGKALPLYRQALQMRKKLLGDEHPDVALNLYGLAGFYSDMGDYGKALPLCTQALRMRKKLLGDEHPDVAASLSFLAWLYTRMGEYGKALPLYIQAIEMAEKLLGDEHPDVALNLNNLGVLYQCMGEYGQALSLYTQVLEIWNKALGPEHPFVAMGLSNLAEVYAATGRAPEALGLMAQAHAITDKQVRMILGATAESTQLASIQQEGDYVDRLLSLVAAHLPRQTDAVQMAANALVRSKGLTLEALGRQRDVVALSPDASVRARFEELTQTRQQLARAAFAGPGGAGPAAYRKRLEELTAQQERLEADLARKSAEFALDRQTETANLAAVARALPAGSRLVEIARPRIFDFKATGKQPRWKPARYLAFVVEAGPDPKPALVDLGEAEPIERAVSELRKRMGDAGRDIQRLGHKAAEAAAQKPAKRLYELVFRPLEPALADARHVLICPEGQLSLVPFEALCDASGAYLVERCQFTYLAASRDVVGYAGQPQTSSRAAEPLIVSDPDFDLGCGRQLALARGLAGAEGLVRSGRSGALSQLQFERLPGTRDEGERIARVLAQGTAHPTTQRLVGADAIEAAVKAARAPRVLHLATHGFFLHDQEIEPSDDLMTRGLGGIAAGGHAARLGPGVKLENPLLRSGLALAGGNRWAEAARAGDVDDGLLTALEVTGMNLRGTELVVLSACDTGMGDVKVGEGVFGLRRAFIVAGARTLVTSLWKVPDAETVELMAGLYTGWLSGKSKSEAMRDTQLAMTKTLRERHGAAHPFLWAGFVLVGDWR